LHLIISPLPIDVFVIFSSFWEQWYPGPDPAGRSDVELFAAVGVCE